MRISPTLLCTVALLVAQTDATEEPKDGAEIPMVLNTSPAYTAGGQEIVAVDLTKPLPSTVVKPKKRCCECFRQADSGTKFILILAGVLAVFATYFIFAFGFQEIIACSLTAAATAHCFKPS